MRPNPSLEARPNIKPPGPHGGRGAFSTVRAWRFAVGPASARTLGHAEMPTQQPPRASAPLGAHVIGPHAVPWPRPPRLNRASRGLKSQSVVGASRRLNSQVLEGTSRRLKSQSVAVAAAASQLALWRSVSPANVMAAPTRRSRPWFSAVVPSLKFSLGLHRGSPPAWPNPSLKRSANGRPPGPVWRYAVHFRQPGPGVPPLVPA